MSQLSQWQWTEQYRHYVDAVAAHIERREKRVAKIRAEVQSEYQSVTMDNKRVPPSHVINGRIATDPVVRTEQANVDRNVALATMYGLGAVIELTKALVDKQ